MQVHNDTDSVLKPFLQKISPGDESSRLGHPECHQEQVLGAFAFL